MSPEARWTRPLTVDETGTPELLGAKAHGLVGLMRLGSPVPAAFVVTTEACRAFLDSGVFPPGLDAELDLALARLESVTGRTFGDPGPGSGPVRALTVSVRSGASVSMPGMMDTVLGLGTGSDPGEEVRAAIRSVFASWHTPRARTYRTLHGIPHDLGTAVVVQAMVDGDRDEHSGAGVAFGRDPNSGASGPYGEVLFGSRGDAVVSGGRRTLPLDDLAHREPGVWADLTRALTLIEKDLRDTCYVEFTFESGRLWLLQARPGRFTGAAAVRVAVDLVDEGTLTRREALLRVTPAHLGRARVPRVVPPPGVEPLARGIGAVPGVVTGRAATTCEAAVRMAAEGPVVLVRPETSPMDMSGLAAAAGVVTERGGPASHAAVVARSLGRPAVVGVGAHTLTDGDLVTVDGTAGLVVAGRSEVTTEAALPHLRRLLIWADEVSGEDPDLPEVERLRAAHRVLDRHRPETLRTPLRPKC
ncbi:PEP/pyruvate-binding domain-containing protein [Nocardiopsis sp. NPDC006832]|uniref:PEP/pyruvate-binding domain-containing protein n=1 Tax=Nocardiopsis sp. NPDC006832 TaxID=3157188 RepID=UPI0033CDEE92